MSSLVVKDDVLLCGNPKCEQHVQKCANRESHDICNCHFQPDDEETTTLCRSCRLTTVIPDLSIEGNVARWQALEAAKRRLLDSLDSLDLSFATGDDGDDGDDRPPLTFEFKADLPDARVMTGHAGGVITINLRESSPVEREKSREKFGEPHRTLIGHFRHEVGHYYWMTLVEGRDEPTFMTHFGDHAQPPYGEAMPAYYENGPPADWPSRFISQYASAHPWEDFAETSAFYLDMCGVLDTVAYRLPNQIESPPVYEFDAMLADYRRIGMICNEINRSMGLTDLLPEVVSEPVVEKLRYVHGLYAGDTSSGDSTTPFP